MYFRGNALILPLNIHASRVPDLKRPGCLMTELSVPVEGIVDFRVRTEGVGPAVVFEAGFHRVLHQTATVSPWMVGIEGGSSEPGPGPQQYSGGLAFNVPSVPMAFGVIRGT